MPLSQLQVHFLWTNLASKAFIFMSKSGEEPHKASSAKHCLKVITFLIFFFFKFYMCYFHESMHEITTALCITVIWFKDLLTKLQFPLLSVQ